MDTDQVDYSEDPFLDRVILGNPNFSVSVSAPFPVTKHTSPAVSPVVTLPSYSAAPSPSEPPPVVSLGLESPPLSLGTLHILSTFTPHSISFDPHLPLSSVFATPPVNAPVIGPNNPPVSGLRPSGCFETTAVKIKPVKNISPEGAPNPFVDHPLPPRTKKRKTKCIKATAKDITIRFGDTSAIGEAAVMVRTVLVGHVRGRAYSANRLTQWVKEIWGALLKELSEVHVLP